MKKEDMPKSLRKYFRKEKAKIRRNLMDEEKQGELIKQLYLDKGIEVENDEE